MASTEDRAVEVPLGFLRQQRVVLAAALRAFQGRDEMNAALNISEARPSPITTAVQAQISELDNVIANAPLSPAPPATEGPLA